MNRRNFIRAGAATLAAGLLNITAVQADENYPNKNIHVIVPYAAGGVVDVQTRAMTDVLQKILGTTVVVEARPGASGSIAARHVANAKPDGYTLLVSASFLINNPLMEDNLPWSPEDFTPVSRFALSPSYFTVPKDSPANNLKEFVQLAKQASPAWQYGDGGTGTPQTMASEVFKLEAGLLDMEPIMYKGAPPMVPDLVNGLIPMGILPSTVAIPQIKNGNIRVLANVSDKRSPQLPDVPTAAEEGFPQMTTLSWYGIHAPKGTPTHVIQKLNAAIKEACDNEKTQQQLINAGGEVAYLDTEDFAQFIEKDTDRWTKIVELLNDNQQ